MAKRKRRKNPGGGFGSSRRPRPGPPPEEAPPLPPAGAEPTMRLVQKLMAREDFDSPEKMQAYLNE